MHPSIRSMREEDIPMLAALRHATFFADGKISQQADGDGLKRLLTDDFQAGFVAEVGGAIAGSSLFVRNEIEPLHDVSPWLAGLVVVEKCRGQGLARALVEAVEHHARTRNCLELYLYTDAAEGLYAKLGWTVVERLLIDADPLVLMKRVL